MTKDEAYLKHILDAISAIEKFSQGLSKEEFFENQEKQFAVLRALEVVGEATKNLSSELKNKYSEMNWRKIAGMRDKLIHAYFVVDLLLVWDTITIDLPRLKALIKKMLADIQ
ncbi:MAG: DUF86 domain-containing protein [Candidatus Bathyarchaeota archaeon]|nr:DUF86 domain-containing protein [Candidatus Bathyarchaeota archaeon]